MDDLLNMFNSEKESKSNDKESKSISSDSMSDYQSDARTSYNMSELSE